MLDLPPASPRISMESWSISMTSFTLILNMSARLPSVLVRGILHSSVRSDSVTRVTSSSSGRAGRMLTPSAMQARVGAVKVLQATCERASSLCTLYSP